MLENTEQSIKCGCAVPNKNSKTKGEINKNLMIVEKIEGLMNQVNDLVSQLEPGLNGFEQSSKDNEIRRRRRTMKSQAFDEINLFQTTTQHELRKAFE